MRVDLLGHAAVVAARHAGRAERERRLAGETVRALVDAGFARHFVSRARGGAEGGFAELVHRSARLAERGCPSAAWCAALLAAHGRIASYLPARGRDEVWAQGPDARIAAALFPPAGTAVPAAGGGLLLSGYWKCASGVDFADWVLLAAPQEPGGGALVLAVPARDLTVLDTWDSPGLRGTGSNSVLAESVHVPHHRTFLLADLMAGRPGAGRSRCHGAPAHLAGALMFAAPALGAATRALHLWTRRAAPDTAHAPDTPRAPDTADTADRAGTADTADTAGTADTADTARTADTADTADTARTVGAAGTAGIAGTTGTAGTAGAAGIADTLARASGEIDTAGLLLTEAARRADTEPVTEHLVARNRRDAVLAVTLLATAVRRLADTTDPHEERPVEDLHGATLLRLCRDVTTVASHGALRMGPAAEAFAAAVLRPAAP